MQAGFTRNCEKTAVSSKPRPQFTKNSINLPTLVNYSLDLLDSFYKFKTLVNCKLNLLIFYKKSFILVNRYRSLKQQTQTRACQHFSVKQPIIRLLFSIDFDTSFAIH